MVPSKYGSILTTKHDHCYLVLSYLKTQINIEVEFSMFASPRSSCTDCLSPAYISSAHISALSHLKEQMKVFLDVAIVSTAFFSRKGVLILIEGTTFIHLAIFLATYFVCP